MTVSARKTIRNFLAEHGLGSLVRLYAEEYLGALLRGFPGFEGMVLRAGLYRLLFRRLDGFAFIYAGARIDHCGGISGGRSLSIHSGAFVSGRGGLSIGDGVLIGPNAAVVSTEHRYDDPQLPIVEQGQRLVPTAIANDVWIGANAVILAGVSVAEGTIVSAGAVVTSDTQPYTIVGGVPAKTIGQRPRAAELAPARQVPARPGDSC